MNLPSKDKNGNSFLTYSQMQCFLYDRNQYKTTYIDKEPFVSNEYIDFGNKVGKALETGCFSGFDVNEILTLSDVTRLDVFERKTCLEHKGFNIYGRIDTCDYDIKTIIDYKTGGPRKEYQYIESKYNQIHIYALSIMQETGIKPDYGAIEFIRREKIGKMLKVSSEKPIHIPLDISLEKLKKVYWDIFNIAKEIECFYQKILTCKRQ